MKQRNNKFSLRRLVYNNNFIAALSIIMAFVVWLIIMINRNPVREQVFNDITATVSIDNTMASEMGLGIVSDVSTQKFTVTVSGPNYLVSSLKPEDILLSASVTDVNAAGTYSLEVLGTHNSSKKGYSFTSISPATIDVTFDYIDVKEYTVTPKLIGVSATEGLSAEAPTVSNTDESTITIKGPRSVTDRIDTVCAYAEINKKLDETQSFDADIVLYDKDGKVIYRYAQDGKIYDADDKPVESTYLTLSSTSVKVTQLISKKATVKVNVVFNNTPSGISDANFSYSVNHGTVSVIGTPDIIIKMTDIKLSAIDFNSISKSTNSFEVSAVLPDGVRLFDNVEYFTVTVDTSKFVEKTFNITNIKVKGLDSTLNASTNSVIRNVKICGPADVMKAVKSSDLYAVADLTDKSEGDHTIDAIIKSDAANPLWQVGTYSTSVKITKK